MVKLKIPAHTTKQKLKTTKRQKSSSVVKVNEISHFFSCVVATHATQITLQLVDERRAVKTKWQPPCLALIVALLVNYFCLLLLLVVIARTFVCRPSLTHTQCHTTTLIFAVYWFSVLLPGAKSKQFFSPLISLCKNLFFVWNFFIVVFMFFSCVNVILYVRYELWFDLIIFYYCGIFLLSRYMVLHTNISM